MVMLEVTLTTDFDPPRSYVSIRTLTAHVTCTISHDDDVLYSRMPPPLTGDGGIHALKLFLNGGPMSQMSKETLTDQVR